MIWWMWTIAGLALLTLELCIPTGFFLFCFGLGALVTSMLVGLEILTAPWAQWLFAGVLSALITIGARRFLMGKYASPASFTNSPEGREVRIRATIAPQASGSCEYRGTNWSVRNIGSSTLETDEMAVVERREGITLLVKKPE